MECHAAELVWKTIQNEESGSKGLARVQSTPKELPLTQHRACAMQVWHLIHSRLWSRDNFFCMSRAGNEPKITGHSAECELST